MRDDLISEQNYFIDNSNVIYNPIPSNIENFIKNNDFSKKKIISYVWDVLNQLKLYIMQ